MMCTVKPAYRCSRNKLLISCASVAIATAGLMPQKVHAQAFQGNINSSTGSVTRTTTSTTAETITVNSPTATINWTPTGRPNGNGDLDFLPSGNVATFQGTAAAGDYTVLNRIIPSGSFPIELNGTVQSFLSNNAVGGNIWFYSPNGILIGANAVFNVGGLLLTTADPGSNWSTSANGFTANMGPAASGSFVTISNGAQINAQNSYVAVVAPRITQAGTVNVNGSAAYVAADQVTMTFNQGLFDIAVEAGTDDPNGIVHTGTTTGTGNATSADHHSIYMVAVPKNQALTMLLSGKVGFTDVAGATVRNGQIILSAGYNVSDDGNGNVVIDGLNRGRAFPNQNASIDIQGGDFTSDVFGYATDVIAATGSSPSGAPGTLNFDHDVTLQGLLGSSLIANSGDTITVGGNATISADDIRQFDNSNSQDPLNAAAANATVMANGTGSINVQGDLIVSAFAQGGANVIPGGTGGSAQGGTARLDTNGGSITVGGDAIVVATGFGGDSVGTGGEGDGGDAFMDMNGGSLTVGNNLELSAPGIGGNGTTAGGAGFGGWASGSIGSAGGSLDVAADFDISADGDGGSGLANPNGVGGDGGQGVGGSASFTATQALQAGASINVQLSNVSLMALGLGGNGGDGLSGGAGGSGTGGETFADLEFGTFTLNEIDSDARAVGGDGGAASNGTGGNGGDAFGGFSDVEIGTAISANINSDVSTFGGAGGAGSTQGNGGNAEGGGFAFTDIMAGGSLNGSVNMIAHGVGGDGANGGEGIGGGSDLFVEGTLDAPEVVIDSSGTGGNGLAGDGGFSQGGSAELIVDSGGSVDVTGDLAISGGANADLNGDGIPDGGAGTLNGGDSQGGSALIGIGFGGGSLTVGGNTIVTASAVGGAGGVGINGTGGTGGSASGGEAEVFATNTSCAQSCGSGTTPALTNIALHDLTLNADGQGGAGGNSTTGGAGGQGDGGLTAIELDGATVSAGDIAAAARGAGGAGGAGSSGAGGAGGSAQGGDNNFSVGSTASINASTYFATVNAFGGAGGNGNGGSGDGGSAVAGFNDANIDGSATFGGSIDAGSIDTADGFLMFAFAQGGDGANGGSATGGSSSISVTGSLTVAGLVEAMGQGTGGNGSTGTGGSAQGGSASMDITGSFAAGGIFIESDGIGGNGVTFGGSASAGDTEFDVSGSAGISGFADVESIGIGGNASNGTGGQANGGAVGVLIDGGKLSVGGDLFISAQAIGGDGSIVGGDGYGGFAAMAFGGTDTQSAGGSLSVGGILNIDSTGFGGNGILSTDAAGGAGGNGYGGTSEFLTPDNLPAGASITVQLADSFVESDGYGGIGGDGVNGGNGGVGTGGNAVTDLRSGTINASDIQTFSTGLGGNGGAASNGTGGAGGAGFGGQSSITIGTDVTAGFLLSRDRAFGGAGGAGATQGDGGLAQGGDASLDILSGANVNAAIDVMTAAFGGAGGNGGQATGGSAILTVEGTLTAPSIIVDTSGTGGNGSSGNGGDSFGGSSGMLIDGGSVDVTGDVTVTAGGNDADGNGAADAAAGTVNGGNSQGGTATIEISSNGGSLTVGGTTNVLANAVGGTGGTSAGGAVGGTADMQLDSSAVTSFGDVFMSALGEGGFVDLVSDLTASGSVELDSGGDVSFANLAANTLNFEAGGDVNGGNIDVADHLGGDAQGAITLGDITAGPNLPTSDDGFSVGMSSGTSITVGNVNAAGSVGFATLGSLTTGNINSGDVFLALASGDISTGSITTPSTGQVYFADASMFTAAGGPDNFDPSAVLAATPVATQGSISVNGPITTGELQAAAGTDLSLGNISAASIVQLNAGGDLSFGDLSATSLEFEVGGSIDGGNVDVTDHVTGNAAGAITLGDINAGPQTPTDPSGFSVGIASGSSLSVGDVTATGNVALVSLGNLTSGNITAGDLFVALVRGDAAFGSITTGSDGEVLIGNASMFDAAGGTNDFSASTLLGLGPVATDGSITVNGAVNTGALVAAAGSNLSLEDVTAGGAVDLLAGGLATFNGVVSAPDITVTSADIDIAAGASLGVKGVTDLITLNAVNDAGVYVGANISAPEGAYTLNEEGDIASAALILNAFASGDGAAPDVHVGDVQIEGSEHDGSDGVGNVTVNTGGSIIVQGNVNFLDAGASDSLTLDAGQNIEVITDTGSITMTNSAGDLSGVLTLDAENVWVADQAIISKLEEDPSSVTANELATSNGTANPNGFVAAGGITADIGSSFLVQNSGTSDDFGGITVGDAGLTINSGSGIIGAAVTAATAATPRFDIYGRQVKGDGTVIKGKDFVPVVKVEGAFTSDSTINGCAVTGCVAPPPTEPPPPPPPPPPPAAPTLASDQVLGPIGATDIEAAAEDQQQAEEDKKKDKDSEEEGVETFRGLINAGPINLDQPIEEPVTSGSDIDINLVDRPDGGL